jgi:hypothetical protein
MRPLRPARKRSPSLARVALQVLVALPLTPALAHADASVPRKGNKRPGQGDKRRPGEAPKPRPIELPRQVMVGGALVQPVVVVPAAPRLPAPKGER